MSKAFMSWLFYQRKPSFADKRSVGSTRQTFSSYARHLYPTWFLCLAGGVATLLLILFNPSIFVFAVAILFGTGTASFVSQIIVLGLIVGLYVSIKSLMRIQQEYQILDEVVATVESTQFSRADFMNYFAGYGTYTPNSSESVIENKIRAVLVSGVEDPTAITDLHIVQIQAKHGLVGFAANTAPLVGLAGTLIGLSLAVAGMQGIVGTLGNPTGLAGNLDVALDGMSGAFFTTLFGITAMILLRFYNQVVQNAEQMLLVVVNEAMQFRIIPILRKQRILTF